MEIGNFRMILVLKVVSKRELRHTDTKLYITSSGYRHTIIMTMAAFIEFATSPLLVSEQFAMTSRL